MIENGRIDRRFLENANQAAAKADGETAWSTASYLVKIEGSRPTRYLRADEIGIGSNVEFVVSRGGTLLAVNPNDKDKAVEGDLEAKMEKDGIVSRTAFDLFRDRVGEKTLAQYAEICGYLRTPSSTWLVGLPHAGNRLERSSTGAPYSIPTATTTGRQ